MFLKNTKQLSHDNQTFLLWKEYSDSGETESLRVSAHAWVCFLLDCEKIPDKRCVQYTSHLAVANSHLICWFTGRIV